MKVRPAGAGDVPELFHVRTSVRENHQSEEELAGIGVTHASVAALLESGEAGGWCAEVDGAVVGFSMARRSDRDVFALFVLPDFEGQGIGSRLLGAAVEWLGETSREPVRLSTGRDTKAFSFYLSRGWREVGSDEDGDPILELKL